MDTTTFQAEGKALSTTQRPNGDLIIEGFAALFEGEDREGENFAPGAFERGAKAFIEGRSPLVYHHQKAKVLGRVLSLEQRPEGLWMRARVDGEIANHPELGVIYGQIKKGTIDGLSIGGFFKRGIVDGKRKIIDMDFTEISTTATPVHPGPSFSVVEIKALRDPDSVAGQLLALGRQVELLGVAMASFLRIAAATRR